MRKSLITLAILIGLMLSVVACAQGTQRSISTPVLRDSPDLPAPLAVISATRLEGQLTRLEGQLGMGPPQNFGHAIALGEHVLAVGAPEHLGNSGNEPGRVYVFQHEGDSWIEMAQLFSSDRDDGFQYDQHFGMAVAMDGDLLFVGAPDADDPQLGDNSGAVYVFQNGPDGWMEIERLAAEQPFANVGFGSQLEVSGDTLLVGEGYQGTHLYIFHNQGNGWLQQASLEIPQIDDLETSVGTMALFGDTLAVSVITRQGEQEQTQISSRVIIYQRGEGQWEQVDV
ncbi:MAG: FG-GAP repeat protein, partial [Anaerolineales bacterium]